jgi:hypothetical protein
MSEERVKDGTWSDENNCAGFLKPCDNKPDPVYRLDDPEGKGRPSVHICKECYDATMALFARAKDQGKLGDLEARISQAEAEVATGVTTYDRGSA